MKLRELLGLAVFSLIVTSLSNAGEVRVVGAEAVNEGGERWTFHVTLLHKDTGWEHFADQWRVVDQQGRVYGSRVLYHPHVHEQPFTRSLSRVKIPESVGKVYIEAHDKVHGWARQRFKVRLLK